MRLWKGSCNYGTQLAHPAGVVLSFRLSGIGCRGWDGCFSAGVPAQGSETSTMSILAPSLLITDDDLAFRETLQTVFEPQGFRTLTAADGEEALAIVESQEVHLALLDMHMPKLTGLETIRRLKQLRACFPAFSCRPISTKRSWSRRGLSKRSRCWPSQ